MAQPTHRHDVAHRGLVPTDQLGSGAANATTYLRGDQSWDVPSSGFVDPTTDLGDLIVGVGGAPDVTNNTVSPTGNVLVVTGLAETILPGCDLAPAYTGGSVTVAWDIWISQNQWGLVKQATIRLRRTDVSGAVLSTHVIGDFGDSVGGHQSEWASSYVDSAVTDGHYVLTVQETAGGPATEIWSDTRTYSVTILSPAPATRLPVGSDGDVLTANSGATLGVDWEPPVAAAAGGTPALTLGTANTAGAASTFIRDDDTILAFDATVPVTQASGDSAATGTATVAARRDHKHGMPTLAVLPTFVVEEAVTATWDGTVATSVLAHTPTASSLAIYKNGLRQRAGAGNDYTLATATLTFLAGNIPQAGDIVVADYRY